MLANTVLMRAKTTHELCLRSALVPSASAASRPSAPAASLPGSPATPLERYASAFPALQQSRPTLPAVLQPQLRARTCLSVSVRRMQRRWCEQDANTHNRRPRRCVRASQQLRGNEKAMSAWGTHTADSTTYCLFARSKLLHSGCLNSAGGVCESADEEAMASCSPRSQVRKWVTPS